MPDAEIHWPSIEGSPYAGQVWAIEVELTPKPVARTTGIMTGLLTPMRYATVVYLTAPAARPVVLRAAASLPPGEQARLAVRDLPAAAFLFFLNPGTHAGPVSVWSWLKLTVCLWLLRKMVKLTGWLLLAALAVAAWPVTVVAVTGYVAAWLRGWPPVRLGRAAAASLPVTVIWLGAEARQQHAWPAVALAPVRDWAHGWHHLMPAA